MKVLGMRKEDYIGEVCEGHNCEFTYRDEEMERHYLYLQHNGVFYELMLDISSEPCGSGYTTSEYGIVKLKEISELPANMIKSKIDKEFDMVDEDMDGYSCDLFHYTKDGGDSYYPMGSYHVEENLFGEVSK